MERTAEQLASLKTLTMAVYALQVLSVFVGITAIVGVIINYVKRDDAAGDRLSGDRHHGGVGRELLDGGAEVDRWC